MTRVKVTFLLPVKDNQGHDLTADIEETVREIYDRFKGWTSEGYVRGAFRMPDGTQSQDLCAKYFVVLDDESRLDELKEVLVAFKKKAAQEAIYVEIQRVDVLFL